MAINSYVGAEIASANDTFQTWLSRTNDIIGDMGTIVVSLGAEDTNTGDLTIVGAIGGNTVFASTELRGGTANTSDDLTISSNVEFTDIATFSSNVVIDNVAAELTITNLKTTVNSANTVFNGDVNFTQTLTATAFIGDLQGTANNSTFFNGQNSSYYRDWNNLLNKPSIPLLNVDNTFTSNGHITIPKGPDGDRPSGVSGMIRFNTTSNEFEGFNGTNWGEISRPDILDDTTTNSNHYLTLVTASSGETEALTVSSTKLYFNPSTGQLNATEFNSLSDETFKENIKPIHNALDLINRIDGISFSWKDNGKESMGVSAQQLQKVIPQIVSDSEVKTVNYNGLIAVLLEGIKELQNKIDSLEK